VLIGDLFELAASIVRVIGEDMDWDHSEDRERQQTSPNHPLPFNQLTRHHIPQDVSNTQIA